MPALKLNPDKVTKDTLRAELQKFNIPLPPSGSRKDAYVELYKSKVLNADRLEFSSDDESLSSTPKRNKKKLSTPKRSPKKLSKKPSTKEEDMDVESLNDDELAAKLRALGVDVGPILDSTRKVYRRKLQKMLDENENDATEEIITETNDTEILENEFSDQDETEVKEVYTSVAESYTAPSYTSPVLQTYKRRTLRDSPLVPSKLSSRTSPRRPASNIERTDEVDSSYMTQRHVDRANHFSRDETRTSRSKGPSDIVTQVKEEKEEKKKGMSIWIQLIIIAVVAVIIFLIIQNMEPANKSPIKNIGNNV